MKEGGSCFFSVVDEDWPDAPRMLGPESAPNVEDALEDDMNACELAVEAGTDNEAG